jgi:hypothetical protein
MGKEVREMSEWKTLDDFSHNGELWLWGYGPDGLNGMGEWKTLDDFSHNGELVILGWWDEQRMRDFPEVHADMRVAFGKIYDNRLEKELSEYDELTLTTKEKDEIAAIQDACVYVQTDVVGVSFSFSVELRKEDLPSHWMPLPAPPRGCEKKPDQ